jgi:hypothetical protein
MVAMLLITAALLSGCGNLFVGKDAASASQGMNIEILLPDSAAREMGGSFSTDGNVAYVNVRVRNYVTEFNKILALQHDGLVWRAIISIPGSAFGLIEFKATAYNWDNLPIYRGVSEVNIPGISQVILPMAPYNEYDDAVYFEVTDLNDYIGQEAQFVVFPAGTDILATMDLYIQNGTMDNPPPEMLAGTGGIVDGNGWLSGYLYHSFEYIDGDGVTQQGWGVWHPEPNTDYAVFLAFFNEEDAGITLLLASEGAPLAVMSGNDQEWYLSAAGAVEHYYRFPRIEYTVDWIDPDFDVSSAEVLVFPQGYDYAANMNNLAFGYPPGLLAIGINLEQGYNGGYDFNWFSGVFLDAYELQYGEEDMIPPFWRPGTDQGDFGTLVRLYQADSVILLFYQNYDPDADPPVVWPTTTKAGWYASEPVWTISAYAAVPVTLVEVIVDGDAVSPDTYEPDDTPDVAWYWDTDFYQYQTRTLTTGDQDWITFYAYPGYAYSIATYGPAEPQTDTYLEIYHESDLVNPVDENDDGYESLYSWLEFLPPAEGWYYIKVRGYSSTVEGPYDLELYSYYSGSGSY